MSETVRKSFKYKLLPTPEQERALEMVVWRCRTLYNVALEQRKTAWDRCRVSLTYSQQKAELPDLKAACPDYAEVNAHVLQEVILRVERAYQAFFRRLKNGEAPRYPRFQGRNRSNSFTYPQYGGGAVLDGGVLSLSKIGRIPFRVHRPSEGTPKTVTIRREADGWYACISCADVPPKPLPRTGRETGIDVGLTVFLVTAEGVVTENPRHYRTAEKKLAKAQRRVARRKKGSKRRTKAAHLLAKAHQTVQRQRRDFHHQTALALLRASDTISLEEVRVANLVRHRHLAKSSSDAGWAPFRAILEGNAAVAGKRVFAVPPQYTSQDGSSCGARLQTSLRVRTHRCPSCGLVLDRDEHQAAGRAGTS